MNSKEILSRNLLTIFNLVNLILALMIISTGTYKNLLFVFVAIFNTLIGIINEFRAKKIVDRLTLISEKKVTVIRKESEQLISPRGLIKGDIVVLEKGDQLTFDAKIMSGKLEVNESFITGEPDGLKKHSNDRLISGSYVVSGKAQVIVTAVGAETIVSELEKTAKTVKTDKSKLFTITNNIVKNISYILIPIGALLLWARLRVEGTTTEFAITSTVAALISMIPEGLILLTSSVLALATIKLSKHSVLVQDLYAIETLARVDTICLDKTGTLTTIKDEQEVVRKESKQIIDFFQNNDVTVKIISGDDPKTVKNIAEKVGLIDIKILDLTNKTKNEIQQLANEYNVFAKAQPNQKRYIVQALKSSNHTVAMTGDGVNDVLAMREADCSISIGDGTDVARRTAKLVLLNSDFTTIPEIIKEGRKIINNLERSATLFLTKTTYATALAIIFTILPFTYPFIPIEMSFLNFVCIGMPAFFLALEPNYERVKDKFNYNIRHYSIPIGIITAAAITILSIIATKLNLTFGATILASAIIVSTINLVLIFLISRPLNKLRSALIALIAALIISGFLIPFARQVFFTI